jgi:hypothetical protein
MNEDIKNLRKDLERAKLVFEYRKSKTNPSSSLLGLVEDDFSPTVTTSTDVETPSNKLDHKSLCTAERVEKRLDELEVLWQKQEEMLDSKLNTMWHKHEDVFENRINDMREDNASTALVLIDIILSETIGSGVKSSRTQNQTKMKSISTRPSPSSEGPYSRRYSRQLRAPRIIKRHRYQRPAW